MTCECFCGGMKCTREGERERCVEGVSVWLATLCKWNVPHKQGHGRMASCMQFIIVVFCGVSSKRGVGWLD